MARGWWEAKDTSDKLAAEIQKKLKAGYPNRNTIFEDTRLAVLYQDRAEAGDFALREPVKIADLLNRFFSHDESDEREFPGVIPKSRPLRCPAVLAIGSDVYLRPKHGDEKLNCSLKPLAGHIHPAPKLYERVVRYARSDILEISGAP